MNIRLILTMVLLLPLVFANTGCATAVVAGIAAAGGYVAHEKGYRVRNPITRTGTKQTQ